MPILKITNADLMKTQNLVPGWYGCQVVKVHPLETSKAKDSINQKIDVLVEGSGGKEITITFNSKLLGKISDFWSACLGKKLEEGSFDTDELMGKKFDGKIGPRLFEGNTFDEIQLFLPYGKSKEASPF